MYFPFRVWGLNSLSGGDIGDYVEDYYRGYSAFPGSRNLGSHNEDVLRTSLEVVEFSIET